MRHIDHLVVAVRDLDRAADLYRRLGFQVGARNQHPWGTENRLIQFGSSFVELITVGDAAPSIPPHGPRRFSFGAFVRDFLREREGVAMLVLSSGDAVRDAARFAAQGIGDFEPFFFERKGRRPDGAETQVAFTLAFASDPASPRAGYFVCQQHFPENFWNPSFQQHSNSATDLAAVTLTTSDPHRHTEFLGRFTGATGQLLPNGGSSFSIDHGRIELAVAPAASAASTAAIASAGAAAPAGMDDALFTSFSVNVADLDAVKRAIEAAIPRIPFTATSDTSDAIVIPAAFLLGVELRFETAP
jgi:catechol 2,3-dioxygenase-like lactoylglutathione lyase family enzyme